MHRARTAVLLLLVPIVVWIVAQLQRVQALTWDEIEFFRATRWIAEGRVPYRDFWEHHTPLQWLLFAPIANVFGGGAGVDAVLAMRWAQLPLWIAACALLLGLLRRGGIAKEARWLALLFLLSTHSFIATAVQYRIDMVGNLAFLGGIALLVSRRWIAFGVVMSAAVLANMRLAPLVVVAALIAMFLGEERWRWNPRALRIAIGVAAAAGAFIAGLMLSGAWATFVDGVIRYNSVSNRLAAPLAGNTLLPVLLAPFHLGDVSGVALWILGIAGAVLALRDFRRAGVLQVLALLFVTAVVSVAVTAVQYDYHLQTTWLLLMLLAAVALQRLLALPSRAPLLVAAVLAIAVLLNLTRLLTPGIGKALDYQDLVMNEVDRHTPPQSKVWDGTGYALRREPAYRYWFLPAGVRFMAQRGLIERYDIRNEPPAAIVFNYRIHNWLLAFPNVRNFAVHHYVPLYRNLWIPGLTAAIPVGPSSLGWTAVADGRYDVWASELLAKHPWIARPLEYGLIEGPDAAVMEIPLLRLPLLAPEALQWTVDGVPQPRGTRTLLLRRGARVGLRSSLSRPAGVLVVPAGVRTLCMSTEERFVF